MQSVPHQATNYTMPPPKEKGTCNCEWLERKGLLEKVSAPFKLTKRSLERVEEPAYFFNV